MAEKEKTEGWYRRGNSNGVGYYYTPFRKAASRHFLAGPGERRPTPNEIIYELAKFPEAEYQSGGYLTVYNSEKTDEIPYGLPADTYSYEPGGAELPPRLIPFELREDNYLQLHGAYDNLASDVRDFLKGEETYKGMGIQYRRGILLYGPPGNGKTSLIRELIKKEIPKDSVTIFMDSLPGRLFLDAIKSTLQDRMKIFVFEELAAILEQTRLEKVLDFLDGERSIDRSLVIATTNYAEKLPQNIVDRPSRFDRLYKHGDPDAKTRASFLSYFLGKDIAITDEDIKSTEGLSVVALREVAILVRVRNLTLTQAAAALKHHRELVKKEFSETKSIGFGAAHSYRGGYPHEDD